MNEDRFIWVDDDIKYLIRDLILKSYDTGYYSGQKLDGSDLHKESISKREKAKELLLETVNNKLKNI